MFLSFGILIPFCSKVFLSITQRIIFLSSLPDFDESFKPSWDGVVNLDCCLASYGYITFEIIFVVV